MSTTEPDVAAALLAAAEVLPAHFSDGDALRLEPLDAIQATTMSLPGGAFAVESVLDKAGNVGTVVLIITGLVDHKNGEVFSRDEARTLWTAALTDGLTALQAGIGEFSSGQAHMTDAFDALDNADEADVVGVFADQTLACLLLALPAESTGAGAAAELAAAVAAATAAEEGSEDADDGEAGDAEAGVGGAAGGESAQSADGSAGEDGEDEAASTGDTPAPGHDPAAVGAGGPSGYPGVPPGAAPPPMMPPGLGYPPGYDPAAYAAYAAGNPAEEQARAAAKAAAQAAQGPLTAPQFMPLTGGMTYAVDPRRIDLLRDVIMGVSVELGRTRLTVQEILGLTPGSIVELDRAAGAPVDVLVNGTLIAHGEVVVVDEEFAVRISEVVQPGGDGRASA